MHVFCQAVIFQFNEEMRGLGDINYDLHWRQYCSKEALILKYIRKYDVLNVHLVAPICLMVNELPQQLTPIANCLTYRTDFE